MPSFALRLKELREEKELTQAGLGDKLNISRNTIASWEAGRRTPELETAKQIADFFDCTLDYLLGRSNERQANSKDKPKSIDELIAIALSRNDGYNDPLPREAVDEVKAAIDYARRKYNIGPYRKDDHKE